MLEVSVKTSRLSLNTLAAFGPSLIVLAFGAFIYVSIKETRRIEDRIDHHNEVMLDLESMLRQARTAQAKARGYAVSGRAPSRAEYLAAIEQIGVLRARLRLEPRVSERLDAALADVAGIVATRDSAGREAALDVVAQGSELRAMDTLTEVVQTELAQERSGIRAAFADRQAAARNMRLTFVLGAIIATLVAWALNRLLVSWARREQLGRLALGEAHSALQASEERRRLEVHERFNALLAQSNELIALLDQEGTITFISPSQESILGFPAEEVLDHAALEFIHPGDADMLQAGLARAFETPQQPVPLELRVRHHDESWRTLQGTLTNLLNDPSVGGIVVNARDVTDAQRIEQQFRQSQKMDAVGRLAGGIAHDFNNLLTAMTGHIGFALEDLPQDSPVRGDIEQIAYAAGRAASLTRQLLTFSRQQQQSVSDVDLNNQINDFARMISRVIGERIDIRIKPAQQPVIIRIDPGQLDQVLMNLAINARDAMPEGGTLTVETRIETRDQPWPGERKVRPGRYALLTVSDTGIGMTPEVRERVFEPFFTTKEAGKGTGLGLATVYGIVKQNGGHVFVYSEPGGGTAFKVFLPIEEQGSEPAQAIEASDQVAGHETIMVVEDETPVRTLIVRALRKHGYHIIEAHNGRDALKLLQRYDGSVDLLLTDVIMPHMHGPELVRHAMEVRPGLPIILMSGYADTEVGDLPPNVRYIDKPFTVEFLARTLRAVLDQEDPPA